jgi:AcrR family transcriptional regulator
VLTPRARFRAQLRDEIKGIALRQLAESGPGGISMNAIGKELGVTGPALYRYFAGRDDLLTELVIDAYDDLAGALRAALAADRGRRGRRRLHVLLREYRAWALAHPERYRLLFGPPLPRYDAHAERLVEAAQASMKLLLDVLPAGDRSPAPRPARRLAAQLAAWASAHGADVEPEPALRAVLTWSRLHGFVTLEIAGNFASMGLDSDALFELELNAIAT